MEGKSPTVCHFESKTLSVCEAELVEGSNCALLLETMETLLRELQVYEGVPTLCIDNSAAGGLLAGSPGSWRTRHLRVRFSYAIERVTKGLLKVQHTPGDRQLADLPTKLHSRARLLDLLQLWSMQGLPELSQRKVMGLVTLSVVLCAMMAVQSLVVEAKKTSEKEPLEVAGASELSFVLALSCFAAVVCWELLKCVCVPGALGDCFNLNEAATSRGCVIWREWRQKLRSIDVGPVFLSQLVKQCMNVFSKQWVELWEKPACNHERCRLMSR